MTPLFNRSSSSGMNFFFFICLSLLVMFLDHRGNVMVEKGRVLLSIITEPVRLLATIPFELSHRFKNNLSSQDELLAENEYLRHKQALLEVRLQKLDVLKQENINMHALLNTEPQIDGQVSGAQILLKNTRISTSTLLLNKGGKNDVYIGQPVLDAHGFLGQVIRIDWFNSVVLPVTDLKSAIPVEVVRTGEQGILSGTGKLNTLILNNIPKTSFIKKGDLLVTSSLGNRFPAGYPVGYIRDIQKTSAEMFSQIFVSPVAKVQKDRFVFLLWPNPKPHSHIASVPAKIKTKIS